MVGKLASVLLMALLCACALPVEAASPEDQEEQIRKILETAKNSTNKNQVECDLTSGVCSANMLALAGDSKSSITITNIPSATCRIIATAGDVGFGGEDLGTDTLDTSKELPSAVTVSIHLDKRFFTSYGTIAKMSNARTKNIFRSQGRKTGLALLVHSTVHEVKVESWPCSQANEQVVASKTIIVRLEYSKWEIDGGGFYAFSHVADESLVTQPVASSSSGSKVSVGEGQLTILRRESGRRTKTDTGVSVNFYPANYPFLGFMFGIAASTDRSPSYFLGTGLRLLSIGRRAVVSSMVGVALIQTKTFPGVSEGQDYAADSPLLTGVTRYKTSPFISIHLGFAIGGPSATSGSGGSQ